MLATAPSADRGRQPSTLPANARTFSMPLADGITAELRWTGGPMTKRALDLFRKYLALYEETISEPEAASVAPSDRTDAPGISSGDESAQRALVVRNTGS